MIKQKRIRAERSDIGKSHRTYGGKILKIMEHTQSMPPNRRWEMRNKEKDTENRKLIQYKRNLKIKFNMTHEEYQQMFYEQNGLCYICGNPETAKRAGVIRRLAVDHNHTTGEVRHLLCTRCNSVLGYIDEDIEILQNMIEYIKEL